MDYYEELGIDRSASGEEIHRAHRRLTKLLHPDQQTDEFMKALAETQMRRLNGIVETLSDPEQRREYDSLLAGSVLAVSPITPKSPSTQASWRERIAWRSLPWWVGSTIGAVVLTMGAVWFWADKLGSSFGNRTPAYVSSQVQDAGGAKDKARSERSDLAPARKRERAFTRLRDAIVPVLSRGTAGKPAKQQANAVAKAPATSRLNTAAPIIITVAPTNPDQAAKENSSSGSDSDGTKSGNTPPLDSTARVVPGRIDIPSPPKLSANTPAQTEAPPIPTAALPPAPKPSDAIAPPPANLPASAPRPSDAAPSAKAGHPTTAAKPLSQNPLEGEWVYAPSHPEKRKPGFYPPEFINLKLSSDQGGLHGQYRARYDVTDKPISPDVSFAVFAAAKDPRKFLWQGSNGSRGTLKISAIDASSIRIEWRTTVFAAAPALTAGTATLVRRYP